MLLVNTLATDEVLVRPVSDFVLGVPADAEVLPFLRYDSDNLEEGRLG